MMSNGRIFETTFSYQYDPNGRINQWTQQQGGASALRNYAFAYDRSGQLTDTVVTDDSENVLKTWSWQYDPAGNRLRESVDTASTYNTFNDLNQLNQIGGSGTTLVEGIVDKPAIVMVNDVQAAMFALPDGDYRFRRTIPVEEGSNTITVEAMDASENVATNIYTVQIGGVLKELEFDLNGNLRYERDDNEVVLREFQWDARNRLVAIIDGDSTTEFEYDGLDRRVRIVEKENDVEQSNVTFLRAGSKIIQKRAADTETILRNYFDDGFTEGTDNFYYTKDHLGSIREVVADDGITIESRYEYTPWGVVTRTEGTGVESDFLYTGHLYHEESGLFLAQYRAYDPGTGRWLSRDPLGFVDGPNLYAYVGNDSINFWDPLGLWSIRLGGGLGLAGFIEFGWNGGPTLSGDVGIGIGAEVKVSKTSESTLYSSKDCYKHKTEGVTFFGGFEVGVSGGVGRARLGAQVEAIIEADHYNAGRLRASGGGTAQIGRVGGSKDLGFGFRGNRDCTEAFIDSKMASSVGIGGLAFAGFKGGYSWR